MPSEKRIKSAEYTPNRLCQSCRRPCKQPDTGMVAKCPRYYPLNRKQKETETWIQMDLL